MGQALMPNFHSHYVICRIDGNPVPYIVENNSEPYYDEIVIEQETNVVPFYFLKIAKNNLLPLAIDIQKRQEKMRQDDVGRNTTIRVIDDSAASVRRHKNDSSSSDDNDIPLNNYRRDPSE